jgi:ribosomal protein S8
MDIEVWELSSCNIIKSIKQVFVKNSWISNIEYVKRSYRGTNRWQVGSINIKGTNEGSHYYVRNIV